MSSQIKLGYVDMTARTTDETFLSGLRTGRLPWNVMRPFPTPGADSLRAGDALLEEIGSLFRAQVDPNELDTHGKFPPQLVEEIRERGYGRLRLPVELGGLDLDAFTTFRVIENLSTWSIAAAASLAITNTVGAGAMLPALEPGPLRDFVSKRMSQGAICSFGDSGPDGQNNRFSSLIATLTEDGSAYILNGRKLFTGNAPIADLIAVSATTEVDGHRAVVFPFLDTATPGFRVFSEIEFIGYRGFPDGEMRFDNVRVPAEHVLTDIEAPERLRTLTPIAVEGRIINVVSPALAVGRLCAGWSRDFVGRRRIDGRDLGDYDQIQRMVSLTLAEVFAIETIAHWGLLGASNDKLFEQIVAKTLASQSVWRIVDRTMTVLGGEGVETAMSKARRGAAPIPLERYFRDARILQVTANVDFQMDNQAGQILLSRFYANAGDGGRSASRSRRTALKAWLTSRKAGATPELDGTGLAPANRAHLDKAARQFANLSHTCVRLVAAYPDPQALFAKEQLVIALSRTASELFAVTAVLARASHSEDTQLLAEVYVTEAWHRIADLTRRVSAELEGAQPDYAGLSSTLLTGTDLDFLLRT